MIPGEPGLVRPGSGPAPGSRRPLVRRLQVGVVLRHVGLHHPADGGAEEEDGADYQVPQAPHAAKAAKIKPSPTPAGHMDAAGK